MLARRAVALSSRRRRASLTGLALLSTAALGACSAASGQDASPLAADDPSATSSTPPAPPVRLTANVRPAAEVGVDTLVSLRARDGELDRVTLTPVGAEGRVPGRISDDGERWVAEERLEPGVRYRLVGVASNETGEQKRLTRSFRTTDLSLDQQTYPSIAPLDGETVGVGMPVIVSFDVAVTDRAEVERHLSVDTKPAQPGSWHWISGNEVHWRPKTYWKPGTEVSVQADVNGVNAGGGIYGQEDRSSSFTVGDAVIMKVDVARHHMKVFRNGQLLRTLPISAGKPGFTTRSGIKVIVEKFRFKDMDAATTGISEDDPEYYDMTDVEYAMRVTYSGEFLHAAPWSVGSQGSANVSHGCVGMSTSDAGWLYSIARRGDVVETTGTDRPMEATNGYGDWNVPWAEYKKGSAL